MSTTFGISRGDFARALNTALKFAGKDDTIPMICGLDLSIHDGKLAVVGTDRFRVGAIRMDVKELTGGSGRIGFLGRDAVAKLLKVIQGGTAGQKREPLMVRVELGIFEVVDVDNTRIALHLQGSEFPRMDKILSTTLADESNCGTFHVNPDFLADFRFAKWNSGDSMRVHAVSPHKPLLVTIGDYFLGIQMLIRGNPIEFDEFIAPWLDLLSPESPPSAPQKKTPAKAAAKAPAKRAPTKRTAAKKTPVKRASKAAK